MFRGKKGKVMASEQIILANEEQHYRESGKQALVIKEVDFYIYSYLFLYVYSFIYSMYFTLMSFT